MDQRPIGIFDSGVGGLTVVKEVMAQNPTEEIIYFGDTARVPYGSKSKETVTKYSRQIVNFLLTKNVKALIIACGTISSNSYDSLVREFDIPILEMVTSGVEACLDETRNKTVCVIGTEATIRSGVHKDLLIRSCPDIKVYTKACPLFVHLAEEGWTENTVAHITSEIYLQELTDLDIDCLLLACTHYPLLTSCLQRILRHVKIIDPAERVAAKLKTYLQANQSEKQCEPPHHTFYVSDNTSKFDKLCKLVLGKNYEAVKVDIEN